MKLKLVVAYDGTDFHGFAAQPDLRTVAGELSGALEKVFGGAVDLMCAGRTDTGVHAWGQVVSFDVDRHIGDRNLRLALNGILAPEIVVRAVATVDDGFDARRSAVARRYRYVVVNRSVSDPFLARYAWWVPQRLDLDAMRMAADPFIGEHDFASFCRRSPRGSTRRVLDSAWEDLGDGVLRYEVTAKSFCWNMARSLVGTMVDVGRGKLTPGDMLAILRERDRGAAGQVAPPHGLCLWNVNY